MSNQNRYAFLITPEVGGDEISLMQLPAGGLKKELEAMQDAVGGYIERVPAIRDDRIYICNDEGLLLGMRKNTYVSKRVNKLIVGPVLYMKQCRRNDGEIIMEGFSEQEIWAMARRSGSVIAEVVDE